VTCGLGLGPLLLLPRCHQELEASGDASVLGIRKPSLGRSIGLGPTLMVLLLLGMALWLPVSFP
jgi:hypothetical protein